MIFTFIIPLLFAIVTLLLRGDAYRVTRRRFLIAGALLHNACTLSIPFLHGEFSYKPFIDVDSLGFVFLILISVIFTATSFYSLGYFPLKRRSAEKESGGHIYVSCMLFFLAAMTLAVSTTQIGVLWIAIESTTLASAPLIYYRQNKRSLEAAWKYLLICSVGIAIALLGLFFVVASAKGLNVELSLASLISHAKGLDQKLFRLGFILVLIGFGTKMGLAPFHNWLPDAHSEAPSPISALLSGTLLNCALLGIIRFHQISLAAGLGAFSSRLLMIFGLISLVVATIFITRQKDYKRLLAYSSIEHMGIISLGLGIGANFASLLHVVGHSLTKALLFLTAGNILILYRSKNVSEVSGLLKTSPPTGILFVIGSLAIVGSPPFLPFISEFLILKTGIAGGHTIAMGLYLLCLGAIFVSISKAAFGMIQGKKKEYIWGELPKFMIAPQTVFAIAITLMGFYLPQYVAMLLEAAGRMLGTL